MRFLLPIVFLFSLSAFGQEAKITVSKPVHKFPKTKEGKLLEHTFQMKNTGTAPLIISKYEVACDCTKAYLPQKPILPGESFGIKVTFDTKGKYYFQDRTIILTTNTKSKEAKIRIKVNVE